MNGTKLARYKLLYLIFINILNKIIPALFNL